MVYDSKYASTETKLLLSQLVHTDKPAFTVKVASVIKQSGSADCGVFVIAYITSIAFAEGCWSFHNQSPIPSAMVDRSTLPTVDKSDHRNITYCRVKVRRERERGREGGRGGEVPEHLASEVLATSNSKYMLGIFIFDVGCFTTDSSSDVSRLHR